jgi:hypothetical protein
MGYLPLLAGTALPLLAGWRRAKSRLLPSCAVNEEMALKGMLTLRRDYETAIEIDLRVGPHDGEGR